MSNNFGLVLFLLADKMSIAVCQQSLNARSILAEEHGIRLSLMFSELWMYGGGRNKIIQKPSRCKTIRSKLSKTIISAKIMSIFFCFFSDFVATKFFMQDWLEGFCFAPVLLYRTLPHGVFLNVVRNWKRNPNCRAGIFHRCNVCTAQRVFRLSIQCASYSNFEFSTKAILFSRRLVF
jgi:hypothetical protein